MSESTLEGTQVTAYVRDAREVVNAGAALAEALKQDQEDDIADAVSQLKEAASIGRGPGKLRFTATGPEGMPPPTAVESALIMAEVDVSIADLLAKASQAAGETDAPASPTALKRAVESTGTTLGNLEVSSERLGFAEQARIRISSKDVKQAQTTFKQEAMDAQEQVLVQSETQVEKAISAVAKQKDRICEAWSELDALSELKAPITGLLQYAWERLSSALQTLKTIAAWITNEDAVEYLGDLIKDASLRNCLGRIVGEAKVRDRLQAMRFRRSSTTAEIDDRSEEVDALGRRFETIAKRIIAIATVAALVVPGLVGWLASPVAGGFALPAVYALGIIAVLAMARDYLHDGRFNSKRGIDSIIGELAEP